MTARIGVAVTGLATLYTVALLVGMPDPDWAYLARVLVHLGELAVLLAIVGSGAAGRRGLGRAGAALAGLGLVGLAVGEATTLAAPATADLLFMISPNLVGLGMILLGVAVVLERRWTGWARVVPLALGIAVFGVLTPLIIVSGGPPAPAAVVGLLVWEVLWVACGVAALTRAPTPAAA
ncbi:hypothetical protein [Pseudonocardia sp. WMMC193]|uniref:hypothetical protein n=1 Tax=Pseudonocardia sp. WMMC193 TaxID=2911965 RepID=UPI001F196133|nr:hypothetical protein [Pseudonocardia sp. WMMC193]MCF7552398.1 hypothetical protein [Pseudonocardia sp. WMMC193]